MNWILFFAYLFLFCWLITRIPFIARSGIPKKFLWLLFIVKIIAGIAYFQFYSTPKNKPVSDTWKFYERSIPETDLLLKNPISFVKGIVTSNYSNSGGIFSDKQSYWNDLKDVVMVKLMAIANVFTIKDYYANIILFNFLFFMGAIAFYRVLIPAGNLNWLIVSTIFLIPSFLFWCSGIHKDGLIFSAISLILFYFQRLLQSVNTISNALKIVFLLLLIFILRSYLVIVFVPCLLIGWLVHVFPKKKIVIIVSFFLVGIGFLFVGKSIHPSLDLMYYLADKQAQFRTVPGNSAVNNEILQPHFSSFIFSFPAAIDLAFFRPHFSEKGITARIASIEIILFWLIFFYACYSAWKKRIRISPMIICCWLFAFVSLLIIGYTVAYSGAVVRYRSIFLPLILGPIAGQLTMIKYYKKTYM